MKRAILNALLLAVFAIIPFGLSANMPVQESEDPQVEQTWYRGRPYWGGGYGGYRGGGYGYSPYYYNWYRPYSYPYYYNNYNWNYRW